MHKRIDVHAAGGDEKALAALALSRTVVGRRRTVIVVVGARPMIRRRLARAFARVRVVRTAAHHQVHCQRRCRHNVNQSGHAQVRFSRCPGFQSDRPEVDG